jgi:hypothetical protein
MKNARRRLHTLGLGLSVIALLILGSPRAHAAENHGHQACSNATLKGTFGFYRTGTIQFGAGGLAAVGILSFDGKGNASVLQSVSRNGDFSYDEDGMFTYQLNPDCTGKGFNEGVEFTRIVVVDGGKGFYIFSESNGNAVHGVGTRISDD